MIAHAARLAAAFAVWCMAGSVSAQQRDWIDAFPSVTAVARAAYEELKVSAVPAKLDFTQDDDSIAVNLAGTFMILRGIMLLKYNEEEDMSPEREEKLRVLLAAYEEAELAIGNGAATRQGYIKRGPPTGQDCKEDMACYRRWFANDILNISGRAEYRERILARLFPCDGLGKAFHTLRQAQGVRMPNLPSPAATLQLDEEVVGVAPPGCDIYGGDADQDGLCDAWEPSPAASKAAAPVPKCEPVQLLRVKSDAAAGVSVTIANNTAMPGDRIAFRVLRAAQPTMDATAMEIWAGEATLERGPASEAHPVARIAQGAALAPDAARPFLIVEATGVPNKGPVQCEQALPEWLPRHQNPPNGLHGPYPNVEQAVSVAGSLALQLTSNVEYGFVVVRDWRQPTGHYYASAPVRSTHDAGSPAAQPLVLPEDFYRSFDIAVTPSCVEADALELAAIVHTHPDTWLTPNSFSMQDFNQAIGFVPIRSPMWFGAGMKLRSKFEKTVLITADDRCVRTFVPQEGDETFSKPELWLDSAAIVLTLYGDYTDRVKTVGCYK